MKSAFRAVVNADVPTIVFALIRYCVFVLAVAFAARLTMHLFVWTAQR